MNPFSFSLIILFGLIFGFVFQDLLLMLGLKPEKAHSLISVLVLPFLTFIGFLLYPIFTMGLFIFADVAVFGSALNGVFLWLAVSFFISGTARFGLYKFYQAK